MIHKHFTYQTSLFIYKILGWARSWSMDIPLPLFNTLGFYLNTAYYWKHSCKIIFKCMNSAVGPSFKVVFIEKSTTSLQKNGSKAAFLKRGHRTKKRGYSPIYGSHEQCTRPTQKTQARVCFPFQCNPNVHLLLVRMILVKS